MIAGVSGTRAGFEPVVWKEVVDAAVGVPHDAVVDVEEVVVGVGADGLGAVRKTQGNGACLATAWAAGEEPVLAAESQGPDGVFDGMLIDPKELSAVGIGVDKALVVLENLQGSGPGAVLGEVEEP